MSGGFVMTGITVGEAKRALSLVRSARDEYDPETEWWAALHAVVLALEPIADQPPDLVFRVTFDDLAEFEINVMCDAGRFGHGWGFSIRRRVGLAVTQGCAMAPKEGFPNRNLALIAAMQTLLGKHEPEANR